MTAPEPQQGASEDSLVGYASEMRASQAFIYAIGLIEVRYPSLGIEKELAQAAARLGDTQGLTERQVLQRVISRPENRYIARELCYVMTTSGIDTYILVPRHPGDIELLVQTVRPDPAPTDIDVVIGERGPIAPPQYCNGLMLPTVAFDQIYSFTAEELVGAMTRPESIPEDQDEAFRATARELLSYTMEIAENTGSSDQHRAMNFLATRYDRIYSRVAEAHLNGQSLNNVEVRPSALSGARNVFDVIFSFVNRQTDVIEKSRVSVDATEKYPFLVSKMAPYFDR